MPILAHGHDQTTEEAYHAAALYLQEGLRARTDGAYTTEIFPEAARGTETEMLAAVIRGELDLATVTAANAAVHVPELGLFSVPYLFDGAEHFRRVIEDDSFRRHLAEVIGARQPGLHCLACFTPGPRNLYTRSRPVTGPADLRGLRLRVMASPVEARVWAGLGAEPVPMPFREIRDALAEGRVDGADDTAAVYGSQRHYEVAPFHAPTRHQWSLALLMINRACFAALPKPVQASLSEIGRALSGHVVHFAVRSERTYLHRLAHVRPVTITSVDTGAFAARFEGTAAAVAEDLSMAPALARIGRLR